MDRAARGRLRRYAPRINEISGSSGSPATVRQRGRTESTRLALRSSTVCSVIGRRQMRTM